MESPKKRNSELNYNVNRYDHDNFVNLFNCSDCGFQAKVISKKWIKGSEDEVVVHIQHIHPEGDTLLCIIDDKKLSNDGEVLEELICGACGKNGRMENVPKHVLRLNGFTLEAAVKNEEEQGVITDKNKKNNSVTNK